MLTKLVFSFKFQTIPIAAFKIYVTAHSILRLIQQEVVVHTNLFPFDIMKIILDEMQKLPSIYGHIHALGWRDLSANKIMNLLVQSSFAL